MNALLGVDAGCARRSTEGTVTTRCLLILLVLAYVLLVIVATYIATTPQPPAPPAPSYLPDVPDRKLNSAPTGSKERAAVGVEAPAAALTTTALHKECKQWLI